MLERFAVMNSQLHGITAQMVPLLEHYVVHPKVSFSTASVAMRIGVAIHSDQNLLTCSTTAADCNAIPALRILL